MLNPQLMEKLVVILSTMEKLAVRMSEDNGGASMTFIRWQLPQHWCGSTLERMADLQQIGLLILVLYGLPVKGDHISKVGQKSEARSRGNRVTRWRNVFRECKDIVVVCTII